MYAETVASSIVSSGSKVPAPHHHSLAETVRDIGYRLNAAIGDFPRLHYAMRELERLLLKGEEYAESMIRLLDHFSIHEMTHFNNLYCYWETELERRFVHNLERGVCRHVVDYPLFARFERLIDREVGLLGGYQPQRLLFIGSGPMPITAFCLQHRLNSTIDCLERVPEAVAESKTVIDALGLTGRINVHLGQGEKMDVGEYDVILIALLAKPKNEILKSILRSARPDVRIICRTSEGSRCFFYEPTGLEAIPDELEVANAAYAGIDDTISSYLLQRKK